MKKCITMLLLSLALLPDLQAREKLKIAILDLEAAVGRSQEQVDGLSDMLTSELFKTNCFTIVERKQVDKIIKEWNFQVSDLNPSQVNKIGRVLDVDAILIGTVNFKIRDRTLTDMETGMAKGEYSIDIRLISVEDGTVLSAAGRIVPENKTEWEVMTSIARELANNLIASSDFDNSNVIKLFDYLYVYPFDLGYFSHYPETIISAINKNNMYGYNDWRLPTTEELQLLYANKYRLGLSNIDYADTSTFGWCSIGANVRLIRTDVLVSKPSGRSSYKPYTEPELYDFESVSIFDRTVTATFTILNPTSQAFSIEEIRTSSSSMKVDWSKTPVDPGDDCKVTVEIDLNGRQGMTINRTLTAILSNGDKLTMKVTGFVE